MSNTPTNPETTCIWCREAHCDRDEEHPVPESLASFPDEVILRKGEVCRRCNNETLAMLDSALCDAFDLLRFFGGVPRKGNRPPVIANRGNAVAELDPHGHPHITINMSKKDIVDDRGRRVTRFRGSARNLKLSVKQIGPNEIEGKIASDIDFGDPRLIRAVHKIGLSMVANILGAETALQPEYDAVRRFVSQGIGDRKLLVACRSRQINPGQYQVCTYPLPRRPGTAIPVAFGIHIAGFDLFVDLIDGTALPDVVAAVSQDEDIAGWKLCPADD